MTENSFDGLGSLAETSARETDATSIPQDIACGRQARGYLGLSSLGILPVLVATSSIATGDAWAQSTACTNTLTTLSNISSCTVLGPSAQSGTPTPLGQDLQQTTFINIAQFLPSGHVLDCSYDETAAVTSAVAQATFDFQTNKSVDTIGWVGCLAASRGFIFPTGIPARIAGLGPETTKFEWTSMSSTFTTNFSGDTVSFDNCFNAVSEHGTTTFGSFKSGCGVSGVAIYGNSTLTGNGVVFYNLNDRINVSNNWIFDVGCGICGGLTSTAGSATVTSGLIREGYITQNRIEYSGGGTTAPYGNSAWPEIGIFGECASTYCTSSSTAPNALTIEGNELIGSRGPGLELCDTNQADAIHDIVISNNQITGVTGGDSFDIGYTNCPGRAAENIFGSSNRIDAPAAGSWAINIVGSSSGTQYACPTSIIERPNNISFLNTVTNAGTLGGNGLQISCGANVQIGYIENSVTSPGTTALFGSLIVAPATIRIDPGPTGDAGWNQVFQQPSAVKLNIVGDLNHGIGIFGTLALSNGTVTAVGGTASTLASQAGTFVLGDSVGVNAGGSLLDTGCGFATSNAFTPTISFDHGGGGFTTLAASGAYSIDCGIVHTDETVSFSISSLGTGNLAISLPVKSRNNSTVTQECAVSTFGTFAWPGPTTQLVGQVEYNQPLAFILGVSSHEARGWNNANLNTLSIYGVHLTCDYVPYGG